MKLIPNASLKQLNSFSVESRAGQLLVLESEQDLQNLIDCHSFDPGRDIVLGAGSNILFTGNIEGTVVLNRVMGKKIVHDSHDEVLLEVCAGENWHQLVSWTLDQGLTGLENLSLIPGLAGAAPMQNIGAYGVELSDVVDSVQALDLNNGKLCEFNKNDCHFAYRDSRFKSKDAGRYLISRIRLHLRRVFTPRLGYAGLTEELQSMGMRSPNAKQVSQAIIRIRQRKLPDPRLMGNAGSFFKNPVVKNVKADTLKDNFAGLPVYPLDRDYCKLSAAWLIEQCGWKGRSIGQAAVSDQHALVLVNRGDASGSEILALANAIQKSVADQFGIDLQTEPRIVSSE